MSGECLSDSRLEAFGGEGLGPSDRERILDHLLECRRCHQRLAQLSRDKIEESIPPETAPPKAVDRALDLPSSRPASWMRWGAIAAGVLLAVSAAIWFALPEASLQSGAGEVWRADEGQRFMPELLHPNQEPVSGETVGFGWSEVEGALGYRLEIVDAFGDLVLSRDTEETSLRINLQEAGVETGTTYYWRVVTIVRGQAEVPAGFRFLTRRAAP